MSLFPFIALVFAVGFFFRSRRKKSKTKKEKPDTAWSDLADTLFERHGVPSYSETKLREILLQGSKKLGLRYGVVLRHQKTGLQLLSHSSTGYWPFAFQSGEEVASETLFCGYLNAQRETIMIDFASLTDWRKHSAYKNLGLETYIGTYLADSGQAITLAFFDTTPREHLFSRADKQFVKHLGTWVSSHIRGREMIDHAALNSQKPTTISEAKDPIQ